jgi:hypothetical protein
VRFTGRWQVNPQRRKSGTLPSDIFFRYLFQTYAHTFFSVHKLPGILFFPGFPHLFEAHGLPAYLREFSSFQFS